MTRTSIAVAILSFALPFAGSAQSTPQSTSMSAHDAQVLTKSAHSVAEYQQLATYFHQQESHYRAEAVAEKTELDRRAQVNAALYQKYPRPVDSAKYFYQSYVNQADAAALQAQHFDQLAATSQGKS